MAFGTSSVNSVKTKFSSSSLPVFFQTEDDEKDSYQFPATVDSLPSSSNGRNDAHRRRVLLKFLLGATTAVAASIPAAPAWAGSSGNLAAPAVVPSPIKPTGEMAKICNVVALGRDDVCLEPKKPPSTYDKILIGKEIENTDPNSPLADLKLRLLRSVAESEWETCERALKELPRSAAPESKVKTLRIALQNGDGPTAVKTILEISKKL